MPFRLYNFIIISTLVFVTGFLLNFVWEIWHGVYLFNYIWYSIESYIALITQSVLGDGMYLLFIYWAGALVFRDIGWITNLTPRKLWFIVIVGLLVAVGIEYKGLYLLEKWTYTERMPTVFTIGLSPLVELAITGVVAFYAVGLLIKNKVTTNN